MIVGVDHILIAVEDMNGAMEAFRRLGFQVSSGGEHPRMGTYNALVPLSDGAYLELIGVKDGALAEQFPNSRLVLRALGRENRIATFALVSNDLSADINALRARGLDVSDPIEGERMRPDGKKVAWRSAHLADAHLPFLIEDITPHHVRVPEPDQGLGQHSYLAELQILAMSVADASRVWKDLLAQVPPRDDEFKLERCKIRLAPNEGRPTGLDEVMLGVDNLGAVRKSLEAGQIASTSEKGLITIDPGRAAGARLAFMQAA